MIETLPEVVRDLRHIGRGEPLWEDEPKTLPELFRKATEKYDLPNALSYKSCSEWMSISSKELLRRATAVAAGLHYLGLRKEGRVAILAANSPSWTIVDAG